MATVLEPIPDRSPLTEKPNDTISADYYRWLDTVIRQRLQATPLIVKPLSLTGQTAAIATTTLWTTEQAGVYRIEWYVRITTADGVASSATVTIRWTDGGVVCSKVYTAITGDTTATTDSGEKLVHADGGTVITYAVAYASTTANKMTYRLDLSAEQMS